LTDDSREARDIEISFRFLGRCCLRVAIWEAFVGTWERRVKTQPTPQPSSPANQYSAT
jgi:hypothetical protein